MEAYLDLDHQLSDYQITQPRAKTKKKTFLMIKNQKKNKLNKNRHNLLLWHPYLEELLRVHYSVNHYLDLDRPLQAHFKALHFFQVKARLSVANLLKPEVSFKVQPHFLGKHLHLEVSLISLLKKFKNQIASLTTMKAMVQVMMPQMRTKINQKMRKMQGPQLNSRLSLSLLKRVHILKCSLQ